MSVLVDSSVWIDYFRNGTNDQLSRLIEENLVVTNDIILSELIPALALKGNDTVIEGLINFEVVPLSIDWSLIREYQVMNLRNGINKVGIPNLIILQQVIEKNLHLYSLDKHFKIMQTLFQYRLFE